MLSSFQGIRARPGPIDEFQQNDRDACAKPPIYLVEIHSENTEHQSNEDESCCCVRNSHEQLEVGIVGLCLLGDRGGAARDLGARGSVG